MRRDASLEGKYYYIPPLIQTLQVLESLLTLPIVNELVLHIISNIFLKYISGNGILNDNFILNFPRESGRTTSYENMRKISKAEIHSNINMKLPSSKDKIRYPNFS